MLLCLTILDIKWRWVVKDIHVRACTSVPTRQFLTECCERGKWLGPDSWWRRQLRGRTSSCWHVQSLHPASWTSWSASLDQRSDDTHRHLIQSSDGAVACSDPTYMAVYRRRAFPVAGSHLWNSLPPDVTSAPTLTVFRNCLKTYLFSQSFPNRFQFLVLYTVYSSGLAVLYSTHSK